MTFLQTVLAALIGSFGGFLGALGMLWIKTRFDNSRRESFLVENLHYELDYNIHLLTKYCKQVTENIEAVSSGSKEIYLSIDYSLIARHFSILFYREGLISKYFHVEDVKRWNDFLSMFGEGSEAYANEIVEKWRSDEATNNQTFKALKYERDQIANAIELCTYFKEKQAFVATHRN